jgi:hypothetical protein
MWTDGRRDTKKLIVVFHNFANVPKQGKNAMMIFARSTLAMTCSSKILTHKKQTLCFMGHKDLS